MLRDSVVVRTRPRAIPLAMITIRKILHGLPFLSHDGYGAPLGGPSGRRSSAIIQATLVKLSHCRLPSGRNSSYQQHQKDPRMASFVSPLHGLCLSQKSCKILLAFELKKKRA